MQAVEISGLAQNFGPAAVLRGIDLSLASGKVLALLGPSGCGKTTLLKLVAGLLAPSAGAVSIFGKTVADASRRLFVPPERRSLGMVFQDYALWPHLSIGGNVGFPLEMRGLGRSERAERIAAALRRVGLAGFEKRNPSSLSGGQQQRVAIARAVVAEPRLVLFDEPLSNLDRELRESLVGEIATLVRSLGLTALYVTHDQGEAFSLADTVAVMHGGRIIQLSTPEELVERPVSRRVAEVLDLGPIVTAHRDEDSWSIAAIGLKLKPSAGTTAIDGKDAEILLPRRALRLTDRASADVAGTVTRTQFRGDSYLVAIRLGEAGSGIDVAVASDRRVSAGEQVFLAVDADRLRWFAPSSTNRNSNGK